MTTTRAVLVTGAARRIGHAIALGLSRHGWAVGIHYHRSEGEARALVAQIEGESGRAVALQADLRDRHAVSELIPRTVAELGPLSCLINNASLFEYDRSLSLDDADQSAVVNAESWDAHHEVNLRAPFFLIQDFVEQLRKFPEPPVGANVINILDQRVKNLTPHFISYTAAKSGLWTLTRTLALALAPMVRVNAIGPGPTLPSKRQGRAHFTKQVLSVPLARATEPDEIVRALNFILGTPSMTGQLIALDGGQHLGWAPGPSGMPPNE